MLKVMVAVSAMVAAVPATAQEARKGDAAPVQAEAVPSAATPGGTKATPPAQAEDARPSLPASQAPARSSAAAESPAPVKTDDGGVQAPPTRVAAIVGREFSAYDRNRNGALEPEEFGAWMAALKARAPDAKPDDKPDPQWNLAAFAKADADGSKGIDQEELASFFNGTKVAS